MPRVFLFLEIMVTKKKFKFKVRGDSAVYSYIGTMDGLKAAYGNPIIISVQDAPVWDQDLQQYV